MYRIWEKSACKNLTLIVPIEGKKERKNLWLIYQLIFFFAWMNYRTKLVSDSKNIKHCSELQRICRFGESWLSTSWMYTMYRSFYKHWFFYNQINKVNVSKMKLLSFNNLTEAFLTSIEIDDGTLLRLHGLTLLADMNWKEYSKSSAKSVAKKVHYVVLDNFFSTEYILHI